MNHSEKLTFNSHCIQIPHDHDQTMWICPSCYDSDKLEVKSIKDTIIQPVMNIAVQSRYPLS